MNFQNEIISARKAQQDGNLRNAAFSALLVQAGVYSYTVNVATLATKYTGRKGETHTEAEGTPRTVAATYSAEILDGAVRASARGELDREAFLDKLAAAGVSTIEARLGDRVIVYEGHGQSYAESISR